LNAELPLAQAFSTVTTGIPPMPISRNAISPRIMCWRSICLRRGTEIKPPRCPVNARVRQRAFDSHARQRLHIQVKQPAEVLRRLSVDIFHFVLRDE
jgi:hypothetical protein